MPQHTGDIPAQIGEAGQPAALLVHPEVGSQRISMGFRFQDHLEGVHPAVGIPDPVVTVIFMPVVRMDRAVEPNVFAVYTVVVHPAHRPVNRGVKDSFPVFTAAGDPDLA